MPGAFVANGDLLRSGLMAAATKGRARVDGVPVVDAAARCVAFDDLDTHDRKQDC